MENGYLSSLSKEGDRKGTPKSEPLLFLVLVPTWGEAKFPMPTLAFFTKAFKEHLTVPGGGMCRVRKKEREFERKNVNILTFR